MGAMRQNKLGLKRKTGLNVNTITYILNFALVDAAAKIKIIFKATCNWDCKDRKQKSIKQNKHFFLSLLKLYNSGSQTTITVKFENIKKIILCTTLKNVFQTISKGKIFLWGKNLRFLFLVT
jgi:hypothetical protein